MQYDAIVLSIDTTAQHTRYQAKYEKKRRTTTEKNDSHVRNRNKIMKKERAAAKKKGIPSLFGAKKRYIVKSNILVIGGNKARPQHLQ